MSEPESPERGSQRVVEGYMFDGGDSYRERWGHICQIIGRCNPGDVELVRDGPMFRVKFGDDEELDVFGFELSPWYPV